jgi:hypothetical protein
VRTNGNERQEGVRKAMEFMQLSDVNVEFSALTKIRSCIKLAMPLLAIINNLVMGPGIPAW